jgi:hypothetical protein
LLCGRVATRRQQVLSRGYDYFFFFEVFFATFLVAAFAVFFAFFAFSAMLSSAKNWLSEHAHAVHPHAQRFADRSEIASLMPQSGPSCRYAMASPLSWRAAMLPF